MTNFTKTTTLYMIKTFSIVILLLIGNCTDKEKSGDSHKNYLLDDLQRKIVLGKKPDRIISLAPNLTEMIYLLEGDNKLVGNTTYCNYPEDAENVTKVGDILTVNYELIVSLEPDLVLITVEGNSKDSYQKLVELGIGVFVSNPRNFEGIKKTFMDIALILDNELEGRRIIADWDDVVDKIILNSGRNRNLSAMFLVEVSPIMVAGENSFLNEYLKFCGLKNISSGSGINYPVYNREEIIRIDPDIIIYPSQISYDKKEVLNIYPEWNQLKAFREDRIIVADSDLYFRPGPRFVLALKLLYEKISELNH